MLLSKFLRKFNIFLHFKYFDYFCTQEVEEETGSAGEQPVSNKLSVLHCNNQRDSPKDCLFFIYYR